MLGRPFSLAACCALGASAFLLPPEVASDNEQLSGLSLDLIGSTESQLLQLPCSSCAFHYKDIVAELDDNDGEDGMFWAQGGANNLLLNFTVSDDGKALLVNDHYIYPMEYMMQDKMTMEDLYIPQIPAFVSNEQVYDNDYTSIDLKVTGAGISESELLDGGDTGESFVTLTWRLLSLAHQPMTVDPVLITLIRTDDGQLSILWVEVDVWSGMDNNPYAELADVLHPVHDAPDALEPPHMPAMDSEPAEKPKDKPCNMQGPFCAINDFVSSIFGSAHPKPCPGKSGKHLPTHIRPHFGPSAGEDSDDEPEHQHLGPPNLNKVDFRKPWHRLPDSKPFEHPPHGGHRNGHHRHGFFHAISRGILAVLIPIMAGITVGIIVSVSGLLFGRFIGWLWFTVLRRGRRGYNPVALEEEHVSYEHANYEKDILTTEEDETLPLYENAPPYESRENTTA